MAIFRAKRNTNGKDQLFCVINGKKHQVIDWSRTGLSFYANSSTDKSREAECEIKYITEETDITLYSGKIELVRFSKNENSDEETEVGASIIDGQLSGMISALYLQGIKEQIRNENSQMKAIEPEIYKLISSAKNDLSILSEKCTQFEDAINILPLSDRKIEEDMFLKNTAPYVTNILTNYNSALDKIVDVNKLDSNSVFHRVFKKEIYEPFFASSAFGSRIADKPLGYAGDFEMMNQLYRDSFEGKSLLGKILHNYLLNEDSGKSVKDRVPMFLNFYNDQSSKEKVDVLSIGSGPALEVQEFIRVTSQEVLDRYHVTLFDLDAYALEHAQSSISSIMRTQGKNLKVSYINASIKRILKEEASALDDFDLIYSGGLFDYLENDLCTALVTKLYEHLKPAGTMTIGNFTYGNKSKAFCHLVFDWNLIHKTENEILAWADNVRTGNKSVKMDAQNANGYLILEK